jgi:hypothetical protein
VLDLVCLMPCSAADCMSVQACTSLRCLDAGLGALVQVCGTPQGGDYEKLRTHMQKASVDAYHRKAAAIDAHEAGLMQV